MYSTFDLETGKNMYLRLKGLIKFVQHTFSTQVYQYLKFERDIAN